MEEFTQLSAWGERCAVVGTLNTGCVCNDPMSVCLWL